MMSVAAKICSHAKPVLNLFDSAFLYFLRSDFERALVLLDNNVVK